LVGARKLPRCEARSMMPSPLALRSHSSSSACLWLAGRVRPTVIGPPDLDHYHCVTGHLKYVKGFAL